MKKRILSVLLMSAMVLGMAGCNEGTENPEAADIAKTTANESQKTQSIWENYDITNIMSKHFSSEEWQEIKSYYNEYVYEIEMYDDEIYSNIRKEHSEYEEMSDEEFWDRVFIPLVQDKLLEEIKEEKLAIMRKPVLDFQDQLSCFLVDADTRGYGNKSNATIFEFTIIDGVWKIKNSNPQGPRNENGIEWTGIGTGKKGDTITETKNAEDFMCTYLANPMYNYTELDNCSLAAFVSYDNVESVYLTYDTTEGIPELNELLKNGGWKEGDTYNWSSGEANISAEGYVVLTAPELKMAE